ncbi:MAG: menaquinone-dependent protoporphyrinogen IX dehydrogenase [Gammaproteobacteria bacterium]|nr:MAG: menaquinone-dependent protoporphyrinogen IX dehydrogenase [Gammaproteobacteria bacterium]
MAHILIIYSTTDGHTRRICERVRQVVGEQGNEVTLMSIGDAADIDLEPFDKIVIGASIRYGKHRPQVFEFIGKHQSLLDDRPSAFFSVSVVARKPDKNQPDTNPYMRKFLAQIRWRPRELAVFAGKIDYPIYDFWDRQIIRFIMWMTRGPTDPRAVVEFTDWNKVEEFGRAVAQM